MARRDIVMGDHYPCQCKTGCDKWLAFDWFGDVLIATVGDEDDNGDMIEVAAVILNREQMIAVRDARALLDVIERMEKTDDV